MSINSRVIISAVFLVTLLLGIVYWKKILPMTTPIPTNSQMNTIYSLTEIGLHNTPNDCWMLIDNKVYDLSSYLKNGNHPGGDNMSPYCGADATTIFNGLGKGRGMHMHSVMAKKLLSGYQIGILNN